jgi:hypothetical protein
MIVGIIILLITVLYSNYLANRLQENEKNNVELWVETIKSFSREDSKVDARLQGEILNRINDIPVILESENGELVGEHFIGDSTIMDQDFLTKEVEWIKENGYEPIAGPGGYANTIYYKNSPLYNRIRYFPLVTMFLLGAFGLFGYYLFSSARRSEQNRVWVGMAKETAHQLGTPISAIMAWIEHLKEHIGGSPEQEEIIEELTKDVKRLDLVADRFSKIGSAPKLIKTYIYEELEECKSYMAKRASKKIKFDFEEGSGLYVMINKHLFDWVIENLIRNALDAMGPNGTISTKVYEENDYFCIDLSDTGKGILSSKFKTVFQPGYSTKQRGWGLGLSLAKRIIENYHSGKIFVKSSVPDEKTTFTIKLPKAK